MSETIRVVITRDPHRVGYRRAEHIAMRAPSIIGEALHVPNTWAATDVPNINKIFQVEMHDLPVRRRGKGNAVSITIIANYHPARQENLVARVEKVKKEIGWIVSPQDERKVIPFSVEIFLVADSAKRE